MVQLSSKRISNETTKIDFAAETKLKATKAKKVKIGISDGLDSSSWDGDIARSDHQ